MIRCIPFSGERLETGPHQFGDDWAGVFIRGDRALSWARALELLVPEQDRGENSLIAGMIRTLRSCDQTGRLK